MTNEPGDPTVLIVDDEGEIIELVRAFVPDWCEIRTAADAAEALDTYGEEVDLVFLDRRLPDRSGDEVLREIRDRPHDCRVAIVSAVSEEYNQHQMEYDAYIPKPFTPEEIEETTADLLPSVDS